MPWLLYVVGAVCGIRGAVVWGWARPCYTQAFRGAAVLYWNGAALALWPGTWWCLLPAALGFGRCAVLMERVMASRIEAGLPSDPFSPKSVRIREESWRTLRRTDSR